MIFPTPKKKKKKLFKKKNRNDVQDDKFNIGLRISSL